MKKFTFDALPDTGIATDDDLHMVSGGTEVGRFWFEDGKLMFEGDADKSAEIFLESLMRLANG